MTSKKLASNADVYKLLPDIPRSLVLQGQGPSIPQAEIIELHNTIGVVQIQAYDPANELLVVSIEPCDNRGLLFVQNPQPNVKQDGTFESAQVSMHLEASLGRLLCERGLVPRECTAEAIYEAVKILCGK